MRVCETMRPYLGDREPKQLINDQASVVGEAHPGPVMPTAQAAQSLRPVAQSGTAITEGFWARRQQVNRDTSIPLGPKRLEEAGNFENFRLAAGVRHGFYKGQLFNDSDVYKWLEAVSWERGRQPSGELAVWQEEVADLIAAAQDDDGYLNTYYQLGGAREARFSDLTFGHELYCAGHLMQAAVAQRRAGGGNGLTKVATRLADHLGVVFAPDANRGVPGHPEVEMALVELYRDTGHRGYLELARGFIDRRGYRSLPLQRFTSTYFQDDTPLREANTVVGHAVRALYLNAGAADVAAETDDDALRRALETQWRSMVDTKVYLTGGVGSRWEGESFGDPYELPADLAYCETCAAIASVQWSWRMLLASGEACYADLIERTLFNAVLSGVSLDGSLFAYVNPLQLRSGSTHVDPRSPAGGRQEWFGTACCPPNVMRTLASLGHYLLTATPAGLQLHQFASGELVGPVTGGQARLRVGTDYPWSGSVGIEIVSAPGSLWELAVRLPGWCEDPRARVNGMPTAEALIPGSYLRVSKQWEKGDRLELELPMPVRRSAAHPKVDAVRGCVALERGPLVYCFEEVDQPRGLDLDSVMLEPAEAVPVPASPILGAEAIAIEVTASEPACADGAEGSDRHGDPAGGDPLYGRSDAPERTCRQVRLVGTPYFSWSNRGPGGMRVWLPVRQQR